MSAYTGNDFDQLTHTLHNGGIAVVRTDTIYGIIALAANKQAVENVYIAKHRDPTKQCIVLLASAPVESEFSGVIKEYSEHASSPTTVVVPATNEYSWLLRGKSTIAYRVVKDPFLVSIIQAVGPIIAPSANPESLPPVTTIGEAKRYFGDRVDCYIDGGAVDPNTPPSTIIEVRPNGSIKVVRGTVQEKAPQSNSLLPQRHSSGGVVFHDNKVLLIHWAPPRDSFDFPKGTIELNETSEQACIREVYEETGYKTRIIQFIGSNEFDFQTPSGEWRHKVNDYYLLELEHPTPDDAQREPHETFENSWVPITDAFDVITRDVNKDIFLQALNIAQKK